MDYSSSDVLAFSCCMIFESGNTRLKLFIEW